MRIVVGIDPEGRYKEAAHLLARLQFADSHIRLAHASEPISIPAYAGALLAPVDEFESERIAASERILDEARGLFVSGDPHVSVSTASLMGSTAGQLIDYAETEKADLVAIGSRRQGLLGSFVMGSVGRALAISARESFLVARGGFGDKRSVRAIFATDHSEYADRCLDELLRLNPEGISELKIVYAADLEMQDLRQAAGTTDRLDLTREGLLKLIRERVASLVERCVESGRLAEYKLVDDYPIEALRKEMYDDEADLLILGAQGHGFWDRLLIGSLALHEVVAEPYSVLVLRLRETA